MALSTPELKSLLSAPRGRKFVVVGAGRTGIASAALLASHGASVLLTDDRDTATLQAQLDAAAISGALKKGIVLAGGGIDVGAAEVVVLSPGVPRAHLAIANAIDAAVPVVNEIEVALGVLGVFEGRHRISVCAITGTNGKSTTTSMLGVIATQVDSQAFVGGNLGRTLCEAVLEGESPTTLILELSSYQLETLSLLPVRAAVVTNLSPDHLDRYADEASYYRAKSRLFTLVTDVGGIALNASDALSTEHLAALAGGHPHFDFAVTATSPGISIAERTLTVTHEDPSAVERIELENERIVGPHNVQNAAAAIAGAALLGLPPSAWRAGLAAYAGIEHRMEVIDRVGDVVFVNDSKATNVDAAVVALKSFPQGIHLIAGGVGKGSSYAPMVDAGRGRVAALYSIGEDAPKIEAAFASVAPVHPCKTLEAAFDAAVQVARPGDVILLSPACASFDQFPNYVTRGHAFRTLVEAHAGAQHVISKDSEISNFTSNIPVPTSSNADRTSDEGKTQ